MTQGGVTTAFTYDGDGQRVKVSAGGVATAFVGGLYEVNPASGVTTTYYYAGSQRIAMRTAAGVTWLQGDHLGSASLATNAAGAKVSDQRYLPYGATRSGGVPTAYQFTGQRLDTGTGLYYYGARYYDAALGRFISADTIVPGAGSPQDLNRYAYTRNNPLRYTDPTGMFTEEELLSWGIGQEQINTWKENAPAWWAIVEAAALGDKVAATHCHSCLNGTTGVEGYFAQLPPGWEGNQRLVMTGFEHGNTLESFRSYTQNQELWHGGEKVQTPQSFWSDGRNESDLKAERWRKQASAAAGSLATDLRQQAGRLTLLTPNELTGSPVSYEGALAEGIEALAHAYRVPQLKGLGPQVATGLVLGSTLYALAYDNHTRSGPFYFGRGAH